MEAIAAFALAGNVLQFIDFSLKVLSQGNALKRSADGTLKEHSELAVVVKHLDKLMGQLDTSDTELEALVKKCKDVGVELKEALTKVMRRNDKSIWSNYRAALLAVWKRSTLEEFEKRLDRLRQEIVLHVQVTSRRAIADLSTHMSTTEAHAEQAASGVQALSNAQKSNFVQLQDKAQAITDSILNNSSSVEGLATEVADLRNLCEEIKSQIRSQPEGSSSEQQPDPEAFLETLKFRGMNDREETIPIAHVRTFDCLLMDPGENNSSDDSMNSYQQERKDLRNSLEDKLQSIGVKQEKREQILPLDTRNENPGFALQQWLSSGSGIYWIWGKPGSGKSTFMKACGHEQKPKLRQRLENLLHEWSSDTELLVAKFFFFRPGSSLQKSHLGLLQSILYQLLSQKRTLINLAFTRREQREAIARSNRLAGTDKSVWSVQELIAAFRNIRDPMVKLFLLIDGIDEMDGSAKDIADILCDITATSTNVKILTAGRWTPEFDKAFGIEKSLNLHETTELDILQYTVDNLLQEDMLQLLSMSDNFTTDNLTADKFTTVLEEIISAAQGVFLWVKIVVDSLLQGVHRFENFDQLHSRIREYPKDLDQLYWFLFENIESRYSQDAAFWLLAVYKFHGGKARDQVTVMELADAERYDLNDCLTLDRLYEDLQTPLARQVRSMIKRMRAQCPHFFEFRPPSATDKRVEFSHRTVLDFLSQSAVLNGLQSRIPANKDPHLGIWAAKLAGLRRRHKLYPRGNNSESYAKAWQMLAMIDAQDCKILWDQLRVHARKNIWPFELDHDFASMDERELWNRGWTSAPTPTARGWFNESKWGRLKRILTTHANPITYLHVSGCVFVPDGKEKLQQLQSDQDLSREERMDIWMLHIIGRFGPVKQEDSYFKLLRRGPKRFHSVEEVLFPSGFDPNDSLWPRVLEYFRISMSGLQLCEQYWRHRKPHQYNYTGLPNWLPLAAHGSMIVGLLKRGANPNALCCNVWQDPDKSLLSALSVFVRLREAMKFANVTYLRRFDREELSNEVDKIIQHLRKAGGQEIVVPPEDHDENEVKLLVLTHAGTDEGCSQEEEDEDIMPEQNDMEYREVDIKDSEE